MFNLKIESKQASEPRNQTNQAKHSKTSKPSQASKQRKTLLIYDIHFKATLKQRFVTFLHSSFPHEGNPRKKIYIDSFIQKAPFLTCFSFITDSKRDVSEPLDYFIFIPLGRKFQTFLLRIYLFLLYFSRISVMTPETFFFGGR